MIPRKARRTREHRDWLELVDREGPFVAVPALKRVYPQGIPQLGDNEKAALRDAKPDFDRAWDAWNKAAAKLQIGTAAVEQYRGARDKWVEAVLRDAAGWGEFLGWGDEAFGGVRPKATSPSRAVTVEATGAFGRNGGVAALVLVVDPVASLRDPLTEEVWTASPIDRMDAILRASDHKIGVVTDGRWWAIVSAQDGVMTASGVVDSQTWIEEGDVRDGFLDLLSPIRLAGGKETDRLPAMFRESVTAAEDITVALGTQVRRAVELLVTAFSEEAAEAREAGRPDPLPADRDLVYEGAVTAMMRVVFLLFAEERSMMPQSALFTEGYGVSGLLDALDKRKSDEGAEALDGTHYTWHRLLATSQALYRGVTSEDMRLPAYGGSLFDPTRFPFLIATDDRGSLAVTVSDRVMLEVLRAVQYATIGTGKSAEHRRVSFRDVDVEQIGYIYEGLLGYTAEDVDEITVGLIGTEGQEPEVPLAVLEDLYDDVADDAKFVTKLFAWIKNDQPAAKTSSVSAMKKALQAGDSLEDADRALLAVTRNEELLTRLRPYVGIIRRDLRERPVVIRPGGLAVVETPSRANSGAHYTPKSLAQEVVRYALEPLVYQPGPHQTGDESAWKLLDSNEILDLKIADIACGSGAFLVAAAEYLAARVLEAWQAEGVRGTPRELEVKAKRQVVAQCLYGADINGMAVEMCKLSLWLVSLDPDLPFSFVDDKVLHGNSLLGIADIKQLEALHIDPTQAKRSYDDKLISAGTLFGEGSEAQGIEMLDVRTVIQRAVKLRQRLASEVDDNDPARSTNTKRRLWVEYQDLVAQLGDVANGIIAAGLQEGGKPGKKLNERYETLRIAVDSAFVADGSGDRTTLDSIIDRGLTPTVETDYDRWKPLHWAIAVPDVLERGGFDAIIGNPPFLGGQKVTGAMGTDIRDWFINVVAEGRRGSADLVAYFFLRATSLLQAKGTIGLIATNTVAQGDTREVGLDAMVADGFTITRAVQSKPWPAASANLEFAAVWGTRGPVSTESPRYADNVKVAKISTLLEPSGRVEGNPVRLAENAGIAFQGCIVLGKGFVLEPEEAQEWIATDPRNAEVLFPYLNGEDLNSRPDASASRWVIDFFGRSFDEAATYPLPFNRVEQAVRPERATNSRKPRRENWWLFAENAAGMRAAKSALPEVLVIAQVSKTLMPVRVRNNGVFDAKLIVFATDSWSTQGVLSSSAHQLWTTKFGTTMRADPTYVPQRTFETFPLPGPTDTVTSAAKELDEFRGAVQRTREIGMTKLYNSLNDPEFKNDPLVARLREMHEALDRAVLLAYGWPDLESKHGHYEYRGITRWTLPPTTRVELLDRLLKVNQERPPRLS